MFKIRNEGKNGYITLITILIVVVIGLSISISLLIFGLNSSRLSFVNEQSGQAKYLTDTCIEQAFQRIKTDPFFEGNDSLSLKQGTCYYNIVISTEGKREIYSSGIVNDIIRKAKVIVNIIDSKINIISWQEIADL